MIELRLRFKFQHDFGPLLFSAALVPTSATMLKPSFFKLFFGRAE
jgi:hypothetical protein